MEINNYSNVHFPRTIDNTYRLTLNGLRFQPDSGDYTGYFLKSIDENGEIQYTQASQLVSTELEVHSSFTENSGNRYSSIYNAIQYINANLIPSAANVILIKVRPGLLVESNQIIIPNYVIISGEEENSCIVVLGANLGSLPFIDCSGTTSEINKLTINANFLADYAVAQIDILGAGGLKFYNRIIIVNSNVANFWTRYAGNIPILIDCRIITTSEDLPLYGCLVQDLAQLGSTTVGIFNISGIMGNSIGAYFLDAPLLQNIFRSHLFGMSISGFNIGILVENSDALITSIDIANCSTCVKLINSKAILTQVVINNNIGTHLDIDATSEIFTNSLTAKSELFSIASGSIVSISTLEESIDYLEGYHQIGNFSSGSPLYPSINWLGQGSEFPKGVKLLSYNGSTYIDVSNDLLPSGAGSVTLFDDLTNSIFYIGDDYKFYTIEIDVSTIISGGSLDFQYWNGSTWISFDWMTSQLNRPYGCYSNNLFEQVEEQDVRFNVQLSTTSFNWSINSVNSISKYWVRIVITSVLTTSPILNRIQILYNSTKIDENGTSLLYGNSRLYKSIPFDTSFVLPAGSTIQNQDIYADQNVFAGKLRNKLQKGDVIGYFFNIPPDMDTSSPFVFEISFVSNSTAATQANFQLELSLTNLRNGIDLVYLSSGAAATINHPNLIQTTVNLTPNQTNGQIFTIHRVEIVLPYLISRNTLAHQSQVFGFTMERLNDSNANSLVLISINPSYLSFCNGISYV